MKIGNTDINSLKIGNTSINKVYIGIDQVWPNEIPFIFTIDTSLGDGLSEFRFRPSTSGVVDYNVEWGDGSSSNITSGNDSQLNHNYSSGGTYQIKVSNIQGITNWNFWDGGSDNDYLKLIDIDQWGDYTNLSFLRTFVLCDNLQNITAVDTPYFNSSAFGMFGSANLITVNNMNNWDVSTLTIFGDIFNNNQSFNESITNWNPVNVSSFVRMFDNCSSFNQDLSGWNVGSMTSSDNMFRGTSLNNTNYRLILNGWTGWNGTTATKTLQTGVNIHFGSAKYEIGGESEDIRNYLTGTLGWTIIDGGGI